MNFLQKKPVFFLAASAVFFAILLIVFRDFAFDSTQLMLNSDQLNGIGSRILRTFDVIVNGTIPAWAVCPRSTLFLPTSTIRWSGSSS